MDQFTNCIQPGVRLFLDNPDVMNAAFIALIIANLALLVVGALCAKTITRILRMPEPVLLAMVLILSIIGSYGVSGKMFDVFVTLGAGAFGFFLRLCGVPTAPIVIGLVLGPILEESLRQGLILTDNSYLAFFSAAHPIAIVLFAVTALIMIWSGIAEFRTSRKVAT